MFIVRRVYIRRTINIDKVTLNTSAKIEDGMVFRIFHVIYVNPDGDQ
jgi:hypothetical protein